ncbi:GH22452 [Drosophila grimshawi]|uniref:GH22452 n=1 Tax=Drosophila grimshawi TaxID=7222 RepID=B4K154_DROGR|nr:GH22452 [Drosophila grimshawi]
MWYIKLSWTILVFVVLFTFVTGSCLEYGHSCWGAHGKRSGNRAAIAAKQPTPYAENLEEQLFNNNNNNNNANGVDDESNKIYNLPLTATDLSAQSVDATAPERNRDVNDAKWTQLLRQHRYQLRQMQRQFDASDAAESWRKLQQAMAEAEQRQGQQGQQLQQQQQQQQPLPNGDFFELQK